MFLQPLYLQKEKRCHICPSRSSCEDSWQESLCRSNAWFSYCEESRCAQTAASGQEFGKLARGAIPASVADIKTAPGSIRNGERKHYDDPIDPGRYNGPHSQVVPSEPSDRRYLFPRASLSEMRERRNRTGASERARWSAPHVPLLPSCFPHKWYLPQGKPWAQSLRGKPRGIDPFLPALRSEKKVNFLFTRFVW